MARHLPDQRTRFVSRLGRLDQHLVKNSNFDHNVKETLPQVWLPYFQGNTPIILDLSDLAKPLAKKMDYLATVRDGNTGELVNGYWLLEMYASLSRKNPVPIVLEPFSHEEPYSPGQNPVVLKAVHKIFELTDKIRRLVLLAALVMIYLGWLVEAEPNICDRLVYLSQPLPDNPDFLLYRLLGGLTEAINTCFWLHKDLLRKSLRENPEV